MKKKLPSPNCITLMLFCQVLTCFPIVSSLSNVSAVSQEQEDAIRLDCDSIRQSLKAIQSEDSRVRVYLGSYYEKILSKFMTPLNVRLVKNNLASTDLSTNQTDFATAKANFTNDFIDYQKSLEDLIATDCKNEPASFYSKLETVREKRNTMSNDTATLRGLISEHRGYVQDLGGKL